MATPFRIETANAPERRIFMRQILRAGAAALGIGALGLSLWDRKGPAPNAKRDALWSMADYSLPALAGRLAVVKGKDRSAMIDGAINALGGIFAFIQPGDRVLIKVNAAFAAPPMIGATTHPDCVTRLVALCRLAGAAQITVADNPINDPAACFELSGIGPAARAAGARVVMPHASLFQDYTLPGGRLIRHWPVLAGPLRQATKLIGLAPAKDHHRSGASMTLKNWYGLLGGRRNLFHQRIHDIIKELAVMIKPTLVILDATVSMVANGPTGGSLDDLRPTHTMIAGTDPVAVDALGAALLGKTPADLPYLAMAEQAGAGVVDYRKLSPIYKTIGS